MKGETTISLGLEKIQDGDIQAFQVSSVELGFYSRGKRRLVENLLIENLFSALGFATHSSAL